MTKYLILKKSTVTGSTSPTSVPELWEAKVNIEAASPEGAIRKYLNETSGTGSGTFVAVPAKSFKPLTVAVEQVTKVTVS